jgi:hypothetical protein
MVTKAQDLVRRLRAAKWVDRAPPPPGANAIEPPEAEVARLRGLLRTLSVSDRSISALEFVSKETKAAKLAENAQTRLTVEARITVLSGGTVARFARGLHVGAL